MVNVDDLIKSYVVVGFKKIYFDCSMFCQDDLIFLIDDIVVECVVCLVKVVEEICFEYFGEVDLEYVIGIEVLVSGGVYEILSELVVIMLDVVCVMLEVYCYVFEK